MKLSLLILTIILIIEGEEAGVSLYPVHEMYCISGEDMASSISVQESSSLAQCAMRCERDNDCVNALYKSQTGLCHVFHTILSSNDPTETNCPDVLLRREKQEKRSVMDYVPKVYQDCQAAFEANDIRNNEVYTLKPSDASVDAIQAVCQFDSSNGWTVIQQRLDGSVDFYRGWNDYVAGFGSPEGEYWIGLDNIYSLTSRNRKLSIYMEDWSGSSATAEYSSFQISDSSDGYKLQISGFSGTAGDALGYHNGHQFSTHDFGSKQSCAQSFKGRLFNYNYSAMCELLSAYHGVVFTYWAVGAWWYDGCYSSNLNGQYISGGDHTSGSGANAWDQWKAWNYSMKTVYIRVSV